MLGTDVDEANIEAAKEGRFPHSAVAEIPADWLQANFCTVRGSAGTSDKEEYLLLPGSETRHGVTLHTVIIATRAAVPVA